MPIEIITKTMSKDAFDDLIETIYLGTIKKAENDGHKHNSMVLLNMTFDKDKYIKSFGDGLKEYIKVGD